VYVTRNEEEQHIGIWLVPYTWHH